MRREDLVLAEAQECTLAWPANGWPIVLDPLESAALSLLDGTVSDETLREALVRAGVSSRAESGRVTSDLLRRFAGARLISSQRMADAKVVVDHEAVESPMSPTTVLTDRWGVLRFADASVGLVFVGIGPPQWVVAAWEEDSLVAIEGRVEVVRTVDAGAVWVRTGDMAWTVDAASEEEFAEVLATALVVAAAAPLCEGRGLRAVEASCFVLGSHGRGPRAGRSATLAPLQAALLSTPVADRLRGTSFRLVASTATLVEPGADGVYLADGRLLIEVLGRTTSEPQVLSEISSVTE